MPWLRNISWVLKLKERCIFHFPKITTDCTASAASLGNVSSHGGFNTSHRTGNHNMWGDYDSTITIHTSNRQTRSLKNTGTWPYLSPDRAALTSLSLSLSLSLRPDNYTANHHHLPPPPLSSSSSSLPCLLIPKRINFCPCWNLLISFLFFGGSN